MEHEEDLDPGFWPEPEVIKLTKLQFEEVVYAAEQSGFDISYFFDKQTGEVEMLGEVVETDPELEERIEEDPENRYIHVPQIESHDAFEDMVEFTETVQDKEMRRLLEFALSGGRGVFRRFKDALAYDRKLTEQWYAFKDQKNKEHVLQLFEDECNIKLVIE